MKKEVIVGGINGVIVGIVTGIAVYVWKLNFQLAVALTVAMTLNFILAGVVGVVVPIALKRLNYDPALAAAAFVTAFTDTFGFLFFLGIAAILI
jgi:magnesium transporter